MLVTISIVAPAFAAGGDSQVVALLREVGLKIAAPKDPADKTASYLRSLQKKLREVERLESLDQAKLNPDQARKVASSPNARPAGQTRLLPVPPETSGSLSCAPSPDTPVLDLKHSWRRRGPPRCRLLGRWPASPPFSGSCRPPKVEPCCPAPQLL